VGLSIEDMEALHRPAKNTGMIPLRQANLHEVVEHRYDGELYPGYDTSYSATNVGKMVVMGPLPSRGQELPQSGLPLRLPSWADWKCGIRHFDSRCTCTPPLIHCPEKAETAVASGRYVLGALHKVPVPGTLSQEDLDFLAWSCTKIAAHWGRLALGQENLL